MWLAFDATWLLAWAILSSAASFLTSAHVVLWKRSSRSAVGWIGIIWFAPTLGCLLYWLFGINRIERRAHRLRPASEMRFSTSAQRSAVTTEIDFPSHIRELVTLGRSVTGLPLTPNNSVRVLVRGESAFPAMLNAIENATSSITLSTYIFDHDRVGKRFVEALRRAVERGVKVRVLIDSVGARYHWPTVIPSLKRAKVPVATFLPSLLPWEFRYANLRNHRKSLVVDGSTAFVGGMNIREGNDLTLTTRSPICDVQFEIQGPVVQQVQEIFALDWQFSTGENLVGEPWFAESTNPENLEAGDIFARCIPDGPDEDLDRIRKMLHGAISIAQNSISIVTPYFLPDEALVTALGVAALRGVDVQIFLPERGNLRIVEWAMTAQLWQVLENGCKVWNTPPPFDHAKLMVVDQHWCFLGSANWDPRSLRLNFELNCELYSSRLADEIEKLIDHRRQRARPVTIANLNARPLAVKLRDGFARLFSPYL